MTAPRLTRPWHRRKRTWAVVALWLAMPLLYALSSGPAWYAFNRGWLPDWAAGVFLPDYRYRRHLPGPLLDAYHGYVEWWGLLCTRHIAESEAASD